jgi:hypothetical protein
MHMLLRWTLLAVAACTAAVTQTAAQVPSLTSVMNLKVQSAQRLVRPIVLGDFIEIDRQSESLALLSYTEIAAWQGSADSAYLAQARAFVEAIRGLREASRDRDHAAATAAYTAMIQSCAGCHRQAQVRRGISLTPPAPTLNTPGR